MSRKTTSTLSLPEEMNLKNVISYNGIQGLVNCFERNSTCIFFYIEIFKREFLLHSWLFIITEFQHISGYIIRLISFSLLEVVDL